MPSRGCSLLRLSDEWSGAVGRFRLQSYLRPVLWTRRVVGPGHDEAFAHGSPIVTPATEGPGLLSACSRAGLTGPSSVRTSSAVCGREGPQKIHSYAGTYWD